MHDYALFRMQRRFRQSLIAGHVFYFEQAQKRLLSQFEDIEAEAQRAVDEWLEKHSDRFDPDRHNADDFYEAANNAGAEFHMLLSEMRDQTRLSVVAGMFHQWDKQLRDWLDHEIQQWNHGKTAAQKVWTSDFAQIVELLKSIGLQIDAAKYFDSLNACRLVVNVYKHGQGKSLEDLKQKYPEYLAPPFGSSRSRLSGVEYRDHTDLKVSDDQVQAFSNAIIAFWYAVPDNIWASQIDDIPDWLIPPPARGR